MVTTEEAFDLVDGTFGELRNKLLPVAVFDLQEAHEVVCFEEH